MSGDAIAQTRATHPGMTFHVLERGAPADATFRRRILNALESGGRKAQSLLPAFDVDIVAFENKWGVIPRIGVNGTGYYFNNIDIIYDSKHPYFLSRVEELIGSALAHELQHHARGAKYGRSLGQRFVSEGLACAFEVECGYEVPFYAVECKGETLRSYAARPLPVFDQTDLNFAHWMFGQSEKSEGDFPFQGGYSLGDALLKAWLDHEQTTSSAIYAMDAKVILDAWRTGTINPAP